MTGSPSVIRRFVGTAFVVVWSAPAAAQPASVPPPPNSSALVITTSLDGQLCSLECDGGTPVGPFTTIAAQLDGERGALVLDAGGLIGASTMSRIAVGRDLPGVAEAIRDAGYRALAVNHRDLATPTLMAVAP